MLAEVRYPKPDRHTRWFLYAYPLAVAVLLVFKVQAPYPLEMLAAFVGFAWFLALVQVVIKTLHRQGYERATEDMAWRTAALRMLQDVRAMKGKHLPPDPESHW